MNYMNLFNDLETIRAFEKNYKESYSKELLGNDSNKPLEIKRDTMIRMLSLVQRYKQIIYMLAEKKVDEVIKPNKF